MALQAAAALIALTPVILFDLSNMPGRTSIFRGR
jgi:hypothetical protein